MSANEHQCIDYKATITPDTIRRIAIGFNIKYLLPLPGGHSYLLIDTGYENEFQKFKKILAKKNHIKLEQIKYIFLTHHHDDHAGFLGELLENCPAQIICHEKAPNQVRKGHSFDSGHPINKRIAGMLRLFMLFHKDFTFPPVDLSREETLIPTSFPDRSILEKIGIMGTIYYTPGHTFDGISMILDNGMVFCGDNAMNTTLFQWLGIKYRPIFLEDSDQIFQSWKLYINEGGEVIYPTHGKPFSIEKLRKGLERFAPDLLKQR